MCCEKKDEIEIKEMPKIRKVQRRMLIFINHNFFKLTFKKVFLKTRFCNFSNNNHKPELFL
jgi:hypothetical protein